MPHDEVKLAYVGAASDTTGNGCGNNRMLISRVTLVTRIWGLKQMCSS